MKQHFLTYTLVWFYLVIGVSASGQAPEIEWIEGRHTQHTFESYGIPGANGQFAVVDRLTGVDRVWKATVYDFNSPGIIRTVNMADWNAPHGGVFSNGIVNVGGVFYTVKPKKTAGELSAALESIDVGGAQQVVNTLPDPIGEDVMVNLTAMSPNQKYSAVYSYSVKPKGFKDKIRKLPYINLFFLYFGKREQDFYLRKNAITVFDDAGNEIWNKSFDMGVEDSAVYVQSFDLTNRGEVFLHAEKSPIRYHYLDVPGYLKNKANLIMTKQTGMTEEVYFLNREMHAPLVLKTVLSDEVEVIAEEFFNNDKLYCRVASIAMDNGGTSSFVGMYVQVLNPDFKGATFIPLTAYDLRNSLSKKTERKIEKGKDVTVTIGRPTPRAVNVDAENGITVLMEEFSGIYSSSGASTTYFKYITMVNANFKGELKWSNVNEQHSQAIDLSYHKERGGIYAYVDDGDMVVLLNDNDAAYAWTGKEPDLIRVMRFDELGNLLSNETQKGFKHPILPRQSFWMNGDLILLGNAMRHSLQIKGSDEAVVGRMKL